MGTITVVIIIRNLEIGNNSISIKYRKKNTTNNSDYKNNSKSENNIANSNNNHNKDFNS